MFINKKTNASNLMKVCVYRLQLFVDDAVNVKPIGHKLKLSGKLINSTLFQKLLNSLTDFNEII